MYLEHFGLSEPPFRITPHTEFFFAGANRGATLEALVYAVIHDEGIIKVSGEVGSGKTMLCRVLMERLPEHVVIVYLANPSLSREDMVFAIADELELHVPEGTRPSAAIRALQGELIKLHGDGRQVVVLIDEAHAMPLETLEEIRLLSNLETGQHKLLKLVLFGQPELEDVLSRPDMRQLKERITQHFELEPLVREDIARYVDFRMRTAGYRGPEVFSPNAVKLIASASLGLTRRVNILAEKSLLAAYAEGVHQVTPRQVDAAIRDSRYERSGSAVWRRLLAVAGMVLFIVLAVLLLKEVLPDTPVPRETTPREPVARQAEASPPPAPANQPTSADREPQAPQPPAQAQTAPTAAGPVAATGTSAEVTEVPPAQPSVPRLGTAAEKRLQETRQWIAEADGSRWFIQLTTINSGEPGYVRLFMDRADRMLKPERVGLYVTQGREHQHVGVIYGEFQSMQAARQAIDRLPAELRANRPFPRQVTRLK